MLHQLRLLAVKEILTASKIKEHPCNKMSFSGGTVVKNPPANAGDAGDTVQSVGVVIFPLLLLILYLCF